MKVKILMGQNFSKILFLAHSPFTMGALSVYYNTCKSILSSFQILRRHYCLAGNLYFCLQHYSSTKLINEWHFSCMCLCVCVCESPETMHPKSHLLSIKLTLFVKLWIEIIALLHVFMNHEDSQINFPRT